MTSRRGLALLVVVGVLGVLALLGVVFATMARLERKASQQRLYDTKALLLARSGLEDALARLEAGQDPGRYLGEDWDASGTLNGFEPSAETCRPGLLDTDACPAAGALRPSFFQGDPANLGADGLPAPRHILVDSRERGLSGSLSGSSFSYSLRVSPQGGFYVNGGDPTADPALGYNAVLRRMLGTLAEAIDREDGTPGNGPVSAVDGFNLVDRRPGAGWKNWNQIRDLALGASQAKLDTLKPYLALKAWVDRKVIAPNALPVPVAGAPYHSWADIKLSRPVSAAGRAPDFERINGNIVGRAPVDLAWARTRRPALIALLAGLKGQYMDESTGTSIASGDLIGTVRAAELPLDWSQASDDCRLAASRILSSTSDLGAWERWNAFCDTILFTGTTDLAQAKRDLLKANFNPNSDLNKFNPNASLWRSVDKSDLLVYSTEFSLLPGTGAQEMESVGRVLDRGGRLLANRILTAAVAPCPRLTLTTQQEFVCGELGDPGTAGDEGAPRLPGQTPFLSVSAGLATARTWGHALLGSGEPGVSLQTYPEPCVKPGGGTLSILPAAYDGSIQLATLETPPDDFYTVAVAGQDMKLLARYTAGFDLDLADASPANPAGNLTQPDVQQVTTAELANGLLDAAKPNTLYPDGCYAERERTPSYYDKGNASPYHGVVSLWIKSNHRPPAGIGWNYRGHTFLKRTNYIDGLAGGPDQYFRLTDTLQNLDPGGGAGPYFISGFFEIGHGGSDTAREHGFQARPLTAHVWQLITFSWDFLSPKNRADDTGELLVDAGTAAGDRGSRDVYLSGGYVNEPATAADITADDLQADGSIGPHRLSLGAIRESGFIVQSSTSSGADATLDELALYDFGGAELVTGTSDAAPAPQDVLDAPGVLASARFKEGRYYKESAYGGLGAAGNAAAEYFSPLIRLGPCRIKALAWSQVVPVGLPGASILFEFTEMPGNAYVPDAAGKPIADRFRSPTSSRVDRRVNAPFRLHAVFQPNLPNPADAPVLDPLALDDVTVLYEPAGGRRISAWSAGE